MRFTSRLNRIKERTVELGSKLIFLAISALFCLWMISGARAESLQIADMQASESSSGARVDFQFSKEISPNDVQVDFQRNFIQLSLKGVSAFPAKNHNLRGSTIDKVFSYQYQPDLARVRILLKGDSARWKDKTAIQVQGSKISLEMLGAVNKTPVAITNAKDKVTVKAASAEKSEEKTEVAALNNPANSAASAAEEKIVKEILASTKNENSNIAANSATPTVPASNKKINKEDEPIFAASQKEAGQVQADKKEKGSATQRLFTGLLTVLAIMAAVTLGFRKFVLGKGSPFQKQSSVIDMVSQRMIAPKKSIALIKVADQYLVVGLSGDNISLLTNLGSNVQIERDIDESTPGGSFANTLQKKMDGSASLEDDPELGYVNKFGNIRNAIKKRMEGLKPLG